MVYGKTFEKNSYIQVGQNHPYRFLKFLRCMKICIALRTPTLLKVCVSFTMLKPGPPVEVHYKYTRAHRFVFTQTEWLEHRVFNVSADNVSI